MAYIAREEVTVTTIADGSATAYTVPVNGFVQAIRYVKDDFTDGVDFTITADDSGLTLWAEENVNASATRYPRGATCDTAGVASLYAAAGEPVETLLPVANERIKIVIASGGNATSGTFHFYVGG